MAVQVERRKKTFSGSGKRKSEDKLKSLQELGSVILPEPPKKSADILPTPERMAKMEGFFSRVKDRDGSSYVVARDAPLEILHGKQVIEGRQYDAGKKFYHHWYRSGLSERFAALNLASGVFGVGGFAGGMAVNEDQAYHRDAYRKSVQHLGMKTSALVQFIVCDEKPLVEVGQNLLGWNNLPQARAAATERLKDALDRLADLYGM
jgi:hypothetical protein